MSYAPIKLSIVDSYTQSFNSETVEESPKVGSLQVERKALKDTASNVEKFITENDKDKLLMSLLSEVSDLKKAFAKNLPVLRSENNVFALNKEFADFKESTINFEKKMEITNGNIQEELKRHESENFELRGRIAAQKEEWDLEKSKMQDQIHKLTEENKLLKARLEDVQKNNSKLEDLKKELNARNAEIEKERANAEDQTTKNNQLQKKLEEKEDQLRELREKGAIHFEKQEEEIKKLQEEIKAQRVVLDANDKIIVELQKHHATEENINNLACDVYLRSQKEVSDLKKEKEELFDIISDGQRFPDREVLIEKLSALKKENERLKKQSDDVKNGFNNWWYSDFRQNRNVEAIESFESADNVTKIEILRNYTNGLLTEHEVRQANLLRELKAAYTDMEETCPELEKVNLNSNDPNLAEKLIKALRNNSEKMYKKIETYSQYYRFLVNLDNHLKEKGVVPHSRNFTMDGMRQTLESFIQNKNDFTEDYRKMCEEVGLTGEVSFDYLKGELQNYYTFYRDIRSRLVEAGYMSDEEDYTTDAFRIALESLVEKDKDLKRNYEKVCQELGLPTNSSLEEFKRIATAKAQLQTQNTELLNTKNTLTQEKSKLQLKLSEYDKICQKVKIPLGSSPADLEKKVIEIVNARTNEEQKTTTLTKEQAALQAKVASLLSKNRELLQRTGYKDSCTRLKLGLGYVFTIGNWSPDLKHLVENY